MILTSSNSSFIPILKNLSLNHPIVTFDPNFKQTLSNLDIKALHLAEAAKVNYSQQAFQFSTDLMRTAQISTNGLLPSVQEKFGQVAFSYLYPKLTDMAYLVMALEEIQPKAILLHNDVEPPFRVAALWAKQKGVPCLHIPHAIYQSINRGGIGTDVHDLVTASHLAAAGLFQRNWYVSRGMPAENVRETGLPQFDSWVHMPMNRERARRLLKIPEHQPVVVYVATWRQDTNLLGCSEEWVEIYDNFLTAMSQLTDIRLIIKAHPRAGEQSFKWHADKVKEKNLRAILTPVHLEIVLHAADLILAPFGSNVLLEGTFVPGLRLMTTHGYSNDKAVLKVGSSQDELRDGIMGALQSEPLDIKEFQYKYIGVPDGKASERIVSFVQELI